MNSMPLFRHKPFDGSAKPFTVGLKPLDQSQWLEVTELRAARLAEKRRLYQELPEEVYVSGVETIEAQREVLQLVEDFLAPRLKDEEAANAGGEDGSGTKPAYANEPLYAASLLVEEDLILMRRNPQGWRLAAGSLCFPSSWSLREKFGKPMQEIHAPVPGFGPGTRMAEIINRMFDGLQGQLLVRYNWSIQAGAALYHPVLDPVVKDTEGRLSKFPSCDVDAHAFIRVERQTLRKLPQSGDILFTIGIHLDPLRLLAQDPDRHTLAQSLAEQLAGLDEAQLSYKGLSADRDRLLDRLRQMADD